MTAGPGDVRPASTRGSAPDWGRRSLTTVPGRGITGSGTPATGGARLFVTSADGTTIKSFLDYGGFDQGFLVDTVTTVAIASPRKLFRGLAFAPDA